MLNVVRQACPVRTCWAPRLIRNRPTLPAPQFGRACPLLHDQSKSRAAGENKLSNHDPSDAPPLATNKAIDRATVSIRRYDVCKTAIKAAGRSSRKGAIDMTQWRRVMQLLLDNTSDDPSSFQKQIKVFRVADRATSPVYDLKRLLLVLTLKSGVIAAGMPKDNAGSRCLILSGFPNEILLARPELFRHFATVEEVLHDEADKIIHDHETSGARSVYIRSASHRERQGKSTVDEILVPTTMTTTSFYNYIEDLVFSDPPRLMMKPHATQQISSTKLASHVDQVSELLVALMMTNRFRPCWSLAASRLVLQYLGRHRKFPQARKIFRELTDAKADHSAEIYSSFLGAAANAQDLKNFQYGIKVMIGKGVRPSWQLWIDFLRMMVAYQPSSRGEIVAAMRTRGLLKSIMAKMYTLHVIVAHEHEAWMDGGGTVQGFLQHLAREWRVQPLHSRTLFGILSYHLHRARWADVDFLLQEAVKHDLRIKPSVLEFCIRSAARHGNPEAAVRICQIVLSHQEVPLTEDFVSNLFFLAWRRRYLCMTRLMWRIGCMSRHVSYRMKSRMQESISISPRATYKLFEWQEDTSAGRETTDGSALRGFDHRKQTTMTTSSWNHIFEKVAAVSAIGVDMGCNSDELEQPWRASDTLAAMSWEERRVTFERDLEKSGDYVLAAPFHTLLAEAYSKDRWIKDKHLPNRLLNILRLLPQVPVRKRPENERRDTTTTPIDGDQTVELPIRKVDPTVRPGDSGQALESPIRWALNKEVRTPKRRTDVFGRTLQSS